jgi:chemotaxis protein MotB
VNRKRKNPEHESHDRWLVSYSDFMTLLFAFFVVMFASSQADKGKAQEISESVRHALEDGKVTAALATILGGAKGEKEKGNSMMRGPGGINKNVVNPPVNGALVELLPSLEFLKSELKDELAQGKMQVNLTPRGLVISLKEAAFFETGDDTVTRTSLTSIDKVAAVIVRLPNPVRLEGHTDSIPIHNTRFRSNWELSAARSIAMMELLAERCRVPRDRMAIAGYADTAPIESNDTADGRAHNRRVDIVILTQLGLDREPVPRAQTPPRPSG